MIRCLRRKRASTQPVTSKAATPAIETNGNISSPSSRNLRQIYAQSRNGTRPAGIKPSDQAINNAALASTARIRWRTIAAEAGLAARVFYVHAGPDEVLVRFFILHAAGNPGRELLKPNMISPQAMVSWNQVAAIGPLLPIDSPRLSLRLSANAALSDGLV